MATKRRPSTAVGCPGCAQWAERYERLVGEVLTLKRDGFLPPTALPAPPAIPQLPKVVIQAIQSIGVSASVAAHLERQAWDMLAAGEPEDTIAKALIAGEEVPL